MMCGPASILLGQADLMVALARSSDPPVTTQTLADHDHAMAAPPPPPELNDDVIPEILLRLPPDEPASLFRASLACKPWRRVLSDPAFLRRYRSFHRAPPLLCFFDGNNSPDFCPVAAASPFSMPAFDCILQYVLDCRHGRVLFQLAEDLLVWDPITGRREEVPEQELDILLENAVVLCAAAGCDHRDCHGGPFLVVGVGLATDDDDDMHDSSVQASVYSSQVGAWQPSVYLQLEVDFDAQYPWDRLILRSSGAVVGDEVYFLLSPDAGNKILKYDLGRHCLSTIDLPADVDCWAVALMPAEDGLLGLASSAWDSSLYLWSRSRMLNAEGVAGWVQLRVIEMRAVLPVTITDCKVRVIGYAEGVNVVFVGTCVGTFTINLESGLARKVSPTVNSPVLPFMSFYTPGMVLALCSLFF